MEINAHLKEILNITEEKLPVKQDRNNLKYILRKDKTILFLLKLIFLIMFSLFCGLLFDVVEFV